MKAHFNHPNIGASRKRYNFACRDENGALKSLPRNGSRKKFCRHCPALRLHRKCIFGPAKAYELLLRYQIVEKKHAALIAGFCTRCKKRRAVNDYEYCAQCSGKTITRNVERAPCAFPGGCEQMVVVRNNRTGMCPKHAQMNRRQCETRRINRAFTVGASA